MANEKLGITREQFDRLESFCSRMDEVHEKATHCRFCGAKMDGGNEDG